METGAFTIGKCLQVHSRNFIEHTRRGTPFLIGSINYKSGASISVKLTKVVDSYEVELYYSKITDRKKDDINYRANVIAVPSNLGKGEIIISDALFPLRCARSCIWFMSP